MSQTIALLSDFGTEDIYTGVMKGVIRGICPNADLIDITHAVEPQHVRQAAFALLNAYRYFPKGTIYLVVVDPGVGSQRRAIAVHAGEYYFIAPDNGVLSYVLSRERAVQSVELTNTEYMLPEISRTFHGRDVFAPAAAHLARGVYLEQLGDALDDLVRLPEPVLDISGRTVTGEVVDIDRFGNVITSIGHLRWVTPDRLILAPAFRKNTSSVRMNATDSLVTLHSGTLSSVHTAYSDVPRGELVAVVGSSAFLEIGVNQGSAAERLEAVIGDRVEVEIGELHAAIGD